VGPEPNSLFFGATIHQHINSGGILHYTILAKSSIVLVSEQ
jgi:hypothetical protein